MDTAATDPEPNVVEAHVPRKRQLVFDHLPKTGGQSVTVALSRAFGEEGQLPEISNPHRYAVRRTSTRRFVSGHLWYRPGERLAPEWFYCTVLRDPIDRFLSQYWFNRQTATELRWQDPEDGRLNDPQVLAAEQLDLPDYVTETATNVVASYTNVQAVHFAERMCADPRTLSEDDLLDAAIRSLSNYDLVGHYDELQKFVDEICRSFFLKRYELEQVNVTGFRQSAEEIPAAVRDRLEAANVVDRKLIEWARRSFLASRKPAPQLSPAMPAGSAVEQAAEGTAAAHDEFGNEDVRLVASACAGPYLDPAEIRPGDVVRLTLDCEARVAEPDLTVGIAVCDAHGRTVLGTNTKFVPQLEPIPVSGRFRVVIHFRATLAPGPYSVTVALHKGLIHTDGCYHWKDAATGFAVLKPRDFTPAWIAGFDVLRG